MDHDVSPEELDQILKILVNQMCELVEGKRMHMLVMGFSMDKNNTPDFISAYGTFGQDRQGLRGCGEMLIHMSDPMHGTFAGDVKDKH